MHTWVHTCVLNECTRGMGTHRGSLPPSPFLSGAEDSLGLPHQDSPAEPDAAESTCLNSALPKVLLKTSIKSWRLVLY